jgi:hypothetical protein
MGDFEDFVQNVIDFLTHEEQNRLYEMEMWIMNGEGVWVLDDSFIAFFGHVLHDSETFSEEHRVLFCDSWPMEPATRISESFFTWTKDLITS